MWNDDDNAHKNFMDTLLRQRVTELIEDKERLKQLRFRHKDVQWWHRRCGYIFDELGKNLYELIAAAHGESWEEKTQSPTLVSTRISK